MSCPKLPCHAEVALARNEPGALRDYIRSYPLCEAPRNNKDDCHPHLTAQNLMPRLHRVATSECFLTPLPEFPLPPPQGTDRNDRHKAMLAYNTKRAICPTTSDHQFRQLI